MSHPWSTLLNIPYEVFVAVFIRLSYLLSLTAELVNSETQKCDADIGFCLYGCSRAAY